MLIPKDEWERKVFAEFAAAAGLEVDPASVTSGVPPQPDALPDPSLEREAPLPEPPVSQE